MQNLTQELNATKAKLMELVNAIPADQTDSIPFEGSWTAGQLLEHVDKAVSPEILHGNVQATDRPADAKVEEVKKIFLDFSQKFTSPEFIEPTEQVHDKNVLLQSLQTKFDQLIQSVKTLNMGEECTDFEVPGMGKFTRYEWISFYMIHTQRHLHQLENIIKKL
ncbi:MAG: DinB family protein [Sphingobacteriales bacterium]|nr:MAG: DinB family protein [Sphingobacteriales bacterium]